MEYKKTKLNIVFILLMVLIVQSVSATNYDYWRESTTEIWTKVNLTAGSPLTLYINDTSTYSADGDEVFIIYDDFGDASYTSKWTVQEGTWSETGGVLKGTAGSGINVIYTSSGNVVEDVIIEFTGRTTHSGGYIIWQNRLNTSSGYSAGGYVNTGNNLYARGLDAWALSSDSSALTTCSVSQNIWQDFKIIQNGNNAETYCGGASKGNYDFIYNDNTGVFAFSMLWDRPSEYDNLTIRTYTNETVNISCSANICNISSSANLNNYQVNLTTTITTGDLRVYGASGSTTTAAWLSPTPANNTKNNTQATINVSCVDGTVYLWFNGTKVIDNQSSPASHTTNLSTSGVYTYDAACYNASLSGFSANETRTWTYDAVYPVIQINSNNAFNQNNYSQISQYIDQMIFNLTFTDNIDLYAYSINVTKNNGATILYNETNQSLSGLEFNYTKTINTSTWNDGWYDIEVQVADSHTANKIPDYQVTKKKSSITFKTENDNNIKIETDSISDIETTKYKDRYNFEVLFNDGLTTNRVFHIKTDKCKLDYRESSPFKGHFVSFCDFSGNWIDFEGTDAYSVVEKIDDYHYTITFFDLEPYIEFKSIGGLNVYTANHQWWKGTSTLTSPTTGIGELSSIELVLSRDSSHDNFSAFLVYNGTTYASPTKTDDGSTVTFNQTITTNMTEATYLYYWNVTYNQTDTTEINFRLNGTQTIFNWSVFNCTSGNITLNLTTYNEDFVSQELNNTVEIEIRTWISNPNNFHNFTAKLEGNSNYQICIYPATTNLSMDFYAQYTTDDGFTHRYILYNETISNTSQDIYMYNTNTTTGFSTLRITTRNREGYDYFSNAVGKLQRYYVSEGLWRTVQMDETGDFGLLVYHIKEQNTDYRLSFYDTSNNLLKQTETLKFSCSSSLCEYTQLLTEYSASTSNTDLDITYNYNNATNIIQINWNDPLANNNKVEIRVSQNTITGEVYICQVFQTGSSGIVNCNTTGYSGDVLLTVLTSNSPYTPQESYWITLNQVKLFNFISVAEGAYWAGGIMITVIGFGLWSPVAVMVSGITGLIFIYFIGLLQPITTTFMIIAIAIGIAIGIKVKR